MPRRTSEVRRGLNPGDVRPNMLGKRLEHTRLTHAGRLRRAVTTTLGALLRAVTRVVPKHPSIVFRCVPDFDDNLRALTSQLLTQNKPVIILRSTSSPRPKWLPPDFTTFSARSLRGIWSFLRASEVYFTHGLYGSLATCSRQLTVNLWHGMPIKRIDKATNRVRPPSFSFSLATSELFADILAQSFAVHRRDIVVTGLPRNDILVDSALGDPTIVRTSMRTARYALMLPTFRKTQVGQAREDGSEAALAAHDEELSRLDSLLGTLGIVLLVKPHPFTPEGHMTSWSSQHVRIITDRWLIENDLTLYGVLSGASFLVTDYSSVAIDFLATGRSLILFQPDGDAYRRSRGLALPDRVLAELGRPARTTAELVDLIRAAASTDFRREGGLPPELWSVPIDGAARRVLDEVERRRTGRMA